MVRKNMQKQTSQSAKSTGTSGVKQKKNKKQKKELGELHVVHEEGKYFFVEVKNKKETSRNELKPELILQLLVHSIEEAINLMCDEAEKKKAAK